MVERFYGKTAVKGLHVIVSIVSVGENEKDREGIKERQREQQW